MSRKPLTIAIGADNTGYAVKESLKSVLLSDEHVSDVIGLGIGVGGDDTAYPHIGIMAAQAVRSGKARRQHGGVPRRPQIGLHHGRVYPVNGGLYM